MTVLSDASLLSLSSLVQDKATDHLPAGAHLRWHLHPALGLPLAGFRLRRRVSPTWPWAKNEAIAVTLGRQNIATSVDGIHLTHAPLRIENAELSGAHTPQIKDRQSMRFVYEARAADDPPRQGLVRFGVHFTLPATVGIHTFMLRGFTHHGGEKRQVAEQQHRATVRIALSRSRVQGSLFISAAEMHSIEFSAPAGVQVQQIRYTTAEMLHHQSDWDTITVLPPLCAPGTAYAVSPPDAQQLALQRLNANRPRQRAGRPNDPSPGPLLTATQHRTFDTRVARDAKSLAASISAAFDLQTRHRRPPGSIMIGDVDPSGGTGRNDAEGSIDLPFYGVLQAGAFAPHVAAMLGLGHHDIVGRNVTYDYAVDAVVSQLWLTISQLPSQLHERLKLSAIPIALLAPKLETAWSQEQPGFTRLFACLPDQQAKAVAPLPAPQLSTTVHADASRLPVQARVSIRVQPASAGTRTLLWRKSSATVPLSSLDGLTGLMMPALPAAEDGLCRIEDHSLDAYGTVDYLAQDVDCFGRASTATPSVVQIKDTIAPLAPAQPVIHLGDAGSNELMFPGARLSTQISAAMLQASPDLIAMTFLWRAGHHRAEDVLARPDGRMQAAWPAAAGGNTVQVPVRLHVQRSGTRREVTAICTAVDAVGNVSPPSLAAHAVLIDDLRPPAPTQLEHPQWTSWPDAHGETRWCARWSLPQNAASARISSAAESRLLALSGKDREQHYALTHAQRAMILKQLAITTPHAFVPEGLAYPRPVDRHDVVLPASSDDMRVVLVEFIGATGQKADWPQRPDAFAVVRARSAQPAPPPNVEVHQQTQRDIITVTAQLPGKVELYALTSPAQLKALDLLQPLTALPVDDQTPVSHVHGREQQSGWLGYCARLRAEDGRLSAPSRILWRKQLPDTRMER